MLLLVYSLFLCVYISAVYSLICKKQNKTKPSDSYTQYTLLSCHNLPLCLAKQTKVDSEIKHPIYYIYWIRNLFWIWKLFSRIQFELNHDKNWNESNRKILKDEPPLCRGVNVLCCFGKQKQRDASSCRPSYKYLGSIIDRKFTFQLNTEHIFSKCQQRLFVSSTNFRFTNPFLLFSTNVSLNPSSHSISPHGLAHSPSLIATNSIKSSESAVKSLARNSNHSPPSSTLECWRKAIRSLPTTHTLNSHYTLLPSGRRYRSLPLWTKRATSSFLPTSIRLLNSWS